MINSTQTLISQGSLTIQGGSTFTATTTPVFMGLSPGGAALDVTGTGSVLKLDEHRVGVGADRQFHGDRRAWREHRRHRLGRELPDRLGRRLPDEFQHDRQHRRHGFREQHYRLGKRDRLHRSPFRFGRVIERHRRRPIAGCIRRRRQCRQPGQPHGGFSAHSKRFRHDRFRRDSRCHFRNGRSDRLRRDGHISPSRAAERPAPPENWFSARASGQAAP